MSTKVLLIKLFSAQLKVLVAQSCPTLCSPMEFSRQEYWSGFPFPSRGDLSNPGIEPETPELQVDSLPLIHLGSPGNHPCSVYHDKGQSRGSKNKTAFTEESMVVADFSLSGCQTEVSAPCCLTMLGTKFCNIITCFHKTSEGESKTDGTTFFKAIIDVTFHTLCHS